MDKIFQPWMMLTNLAIASGVWYTLVYIAIQD